MKLENIFPKRKKNPWGKMLVVVRSLCPSPFLGLTLRDQGERVTSLPEKGDKWGVGCPRGESLCQMPRGEGSWDPPAVFSLCDPRVWMGDLEK